MPLEPSTGCVTLAEPGSTPHLFTEIQDIRILVYTDDDELVKDDIDADFGIGYMKKFLDAHQPSFGKARIELAQRKASTGDSAELKLTKPLLDMYDQVWFFGIHLSNLPAPKHDGDKESRGGPESELLQGEIDALSDWMKVGGVLVTGDHSEARFDGKLLSLGRALGGKVPRASELRVWEAGPTTVPIASVNTLEPNLGKNLNTDGTLESDPKPQRIILLRYNDTGAHDPEGEFHNLFKDKNGWEIDVFPDHMHEGEIPDPLPPVVWRGRRPRIIAIGVDKRVKRTYPMVAVYGGYDGDPPAGRIVVDSTWHHYFNENLRGFDSDTSAGSAAGPIGQYYGNLAIWLSPLAKRQKMAQAMFWWLFNQPPVREEPSRVEENIGKVARELLAGVASACEINELLQAYTPEKIRPQLDVLNYPASGSAFSPLPSQELIIGSVISEYRQAGATPFAPASLADRMGAAAPATISAGFAKAFRIHEERLQRAAEAGRKNNEILK